ncbi:MAG: HEAT repeat domain-containing protein [Microcoleaceae cyanobacterium]
MRTGALFLLEKPAPTNRKITLFSSPFPNSHSPIPIPQSPFPNLIMPDSNASSICIFTTDANLNVRSWDSRMAEMTGKSASEVCGQPLSLIIPDLESRGLLTRFSRVLSTGAIESLAPGFHHYLIPCSPSTPSKYFDKMQQRVTIAPIREKQVITGVVVMIEDVTARMDQERDLAVQLTKPRESHRGLGREQAVPSLYGPASIIDALADESWQVRRDAVDTIALNHDPDIAVKLVRDLREEHHNISILNSVLQVLALSNVDAVPALIACLSDTDADLRIYAALALGEQHDPRAIPSLIEALNDPDTNVRYHAIDSLGHLRATEAVDILTEIAASGDFFLGFPALDALLRIGERATASPRLVPLLQNELLGPAVVEVLEKIGDREVVPALAELLNGFQPPTLLVVKAIAAIYRRDERIYGQGIAIADLTVHRLNEAAIGALIDAIPHAAEEELADLILLLGWLDAPEVEVAMTGLISHGSLRDQVIDTLIRYGRREKDKGDRICALLMEQLDAVEIETREAAVMALGKIGNSRVVPALIALLNEESESELVITATNALAQIGDRRAFEPLLALLGHPDPAVRQGAIAALDSLGHPELENQVTQLLSSPNPRLRESAVRIAGYFAFPQCVEFIFACTRDESEKVRRAAIEHLPYLEDDERALDTLRRVLVQETPRVRAAAARALGEIENVSVYQDLIQALSDEDPWVRYYAVRSLGKLDYQEHRQDACATPQNSLFDILAPIALTDPSNPVRGAIAEVLGNIRGLDAVPLLTTLAEVEDGDGDIARAALTALGYIEHPDADSALLKALYSHNPERRIDSIQALGKRAVGAGLPASSEDNLNTSSEAIRTAVDALQWLVLSDTEPKVIQCGIDTLQRVNRDEATQALIELTIEPTRREACCTALAQLGESHLDQIAVGLNHIHPGVRCAIVNVLTRLKNPKASELLIAMLDDQDSEVRLASTVALGRLGNRACDDKLAHLAHTDPDPAVRRAAQKVLQR